MMDLTQLFMVRAPVPKITLNCMSVIGFGVLAFRCAAHAMWILGVQEGHLILVCELLNLLGERIRPTFTRERQQLTKTRPKTNELQNSMSGYL